MDIQFKGDKIFPQIFLFKNGDIKKPVDFTNMVQNELLDQLLLYTQ